MTANDNHTMDMNAAADGVLSGAAHDASSPAPAAARSAQAGAVSRTADAPSAPPVQAKPEAEAAEAAPKQKWYKHIFFRKLSYALIALLIAVTVWGYVLMSENPVRTKRVENVRLSIDGGSEAGLRSRDLIISDDLTSILPTVTVNVETRLNELSRFDSALGSVVSASIDLNDIRSPGEYVRQISATSTIGTPVSIEPPTVTITVENYVTREIPITYSFVGELPDGYWHDEPYFPNGDMLKLTGAESKISSIVKANCVIDLSSLTESINESFEPVLLDGDHNVLDKVGIVGVVPSVIMRMNVLPYLDIPLQDYLAQSGEINDNYEIVSVSVNPPTLSVAASRDVLDSIAESAYFEPINVSNLYPGTHQQRISMMGLPSGIKLLSDNNFIVIIEVADKIVQRTINIPLTDVVIEGEDTELYNYLYGTRSFAVQFSGPSRIVSALKESDISLHLNVSGLKRGTHEITPTCSVEGEPSWLYDGSVGITVQKSFCTITTATNGG